VLDFEVQRFTRRCAATDRDLQPGETFYSVLLPDAGTVIRRDYSKDAWLGPPDGALGWWKSEVPDPKCKKVHWAPNDVLLHYFVQLEDQPDRRDMRYVLTLLMIRRRILKLDETEQPTGQEVLTVCCPRNETRYQVEVVVPASERMEQIQQELSELLFAKAS
jgi:hypothetical protein